MKLEKRITKTVRLVNQLKKQVGLLREELHSNTEQLEEIERRFDLLWNAIKEDV